MSNESKFSGDPKVIEIEEALAEYAQSAFDMVACRNAYFRSGAPIEEFKKTPEYIRLENRSREAYIDFFDKFDSCVKNTTSLEDKKHLSGRILWKIFKLYHQELRKDKDGVLYKHFDGKLEGNCDEDFYKKYGKKIFKNANGKVVIDYKNELTYAGGVRFLNDGLEAIARIVRTQPLTSATKMKYLLYLVRSNHHKKEKKVDGVSVKCFSEKALDKLVQFDPAELAEEMDTVRLNAYRLACLLSKDGRNKNELSMYVRLQHGFIDFLDTLSVDDVKGNACTYLTLRKNIDDKNSKNLLKKLIDKSSTNSEDGKPNQEAVKAIFEEYTRFIRHNSKKTAGRDSVENMMYDLATYIVANYDYTEKDVAELTTTLSSQNYSGKGKLLLNQFNHRLNETFEKALNDKANGVLLFENEERKATEERDKPVTYEEYLEHRKSLEQAKTDETVQVTDPKDEIVNIDVEKADVSIQSLKKYVNSLCKYASEHPEENVPTDTLLELLKRNASLQGLDVTNTNLFGERTNSVKMDEKVVLAIVEEYAKNNAGNNKSFEDNMNRMLSDVVKQYRYDEAGVKKIQKTLVKFSNDKEKAKKMAENLGKSYSLYKQIFGGIENWNLDLKNLTRVPSR